MPLFWENSKIYRGTGAFAMKRLNTIIGLARHSDFLKDEMGYYGLGSVRQTSQFFEVFGIHVKEQRVEKHLCRFVGKPMFEMFRPTVRKNGMGVDYSKIDYKFVDKWS